MTARLALALLLALQVGLAQADALRPSIEAVEASLRSAGPRATLATHFNCAQHQGSAYEAIASGSPQWIALAERMLAHSDACYTEGILGALGQAMQKAPRQVLPLVGKTRVLAAEAICLPFISDEIPVKAQVAAVARSRGAIQGVRDEPLKVQREACLRFIGTVEAGIVANQAANQAAPASAPPR